MTGCLMVRCIWQFEGSNLLNAKTRHKVNSQLLVSNYLKDVPHSCKHFADHFTFSKVVLPSLTPGQDIKQLLHQTQAQSTCHVAMGGNILLLSLHFSRFLFWLLLVFMLHAIIKARDTWQVIHFNSHNLTACLH